MNTQRNHSTNYSFNYKTPEQISRARNWKRIDNNTNKRSRADDEWSSTSNKRERYEGNRTAGNEGGRGRSSTYTEGYAKKPEHVENQSKPKKQEPKQKKLEKQANKPAAVEANIIFLGKYFLLKILSVHFNFSEKNCSDASLFFFVPKFFIQVQQLMFLYLINYMV